MGFLSRTASPPTMRSASRQPNFYLSCFINSFINSVFLHLRSSLIRIFDSNLKSGTVDSFHFSKGFTGKTSYNKGFIFVTCIFKIFESFGNTRTNMTFKILVENFGWKLTEASLFPSINFSTVHCWTLFCYYVVSYSGFFYAINKNKPNLEIL